MASRDATQVKDRQQRAIAQNRCQGIIECSGCGKETTVLSVFMAYRSFVRFWQALSPPRYAPSGIGMSYLTLEGYGEALKWGARVAICRTAAARIGW
jgi:hypothetical protein